MDSAIIISNGRCGSTLLSDLIVDEPQTCSVQEFFMSVGPWSGPVDDVTGADYWAVLSSPKPELAVLFRLGVQPEEVRYPADGRWAGRLPELPRILAITLPALTNRPDALFDQLCEQVPSFPRQSVAAHHRAFLQLCATELGRVRWVERSGGSTQWAPTLLADHPDARFVYLRRNWPDTARSMSRHSAFQLVQLRVETQARYGIDPFDTDLEQGQLPAEVVPLMPDRLTVELLRARGDDVRRYVGLCAFLSSQAEQALADSSPEHLLQMNYEQLLDDPVGQLTTLGAFLRFADPAGWAARVAHRVSAPNRTPLRAAG